MAEKDHNAPDSTDDFARSFALFAERSQRIASAMLVNASRDGLFQIPDPAVIGKAFLTLATHMLKEPERMLEAQGRLFTDYAALMGMTAKRLRGEAAAPVKEPGRDDRRFKDKAWDEDVVYDFIKQAYLLTSDWLQSTVQDVRGLDPDTQRKVRFYTRRYVNALSPTNFIGTNPAVLRATVESKGQNLVNGVSRLLDDLERGRGRLEISMTDTKAFRIGENVATTPGAVVFQNELMQLIQYAPTTETVLRRPLLIVPPWINKYYVLDLQPKNSFIKWAVGQGHTVFVVSWVNPTAALSSKSFDDYMLEGPLAALQAIERATGEREANAIGYCIGGTLLAATLAYMAAKEDRRIPAATFFTTMMDFSDSGELSVFIDEEQLQHLESRMHEQGYLEGRYMRQVFNLMRDNDLVWSFVVNNYLLGRDPVAFDLLYWNADSTRMPAMMHAFYLRKMYLENKLVEAGGITLDGVPIDLRRVHLPAYVLSTREDHIAPWKSTYRATQLFKGPVRFVLAASGHIAGVINPPAAKKYGYWTKPETPADPDAWLDGAEAKDGSWWPDWDRWAAGQGGREPVSPRIPGAGALPAIEPAPGSYVKVRLPD